MSYPTASTIRLCPRLQPPHNDKFTIVCSGRYSREKAQQQLLKAVAISKHKDEIRVILAGDGPRGSYLKALANRFDIDATFAFFSRDQMVKTLQNADLYVHTAIIEIEAIACMEAICCGAVPVICNSPRSATRFFASRRQFALLSSTILRILRQKSITGSSIPRKKRSAQRNTMPHVAAFHSVNAWRKWKQC